jgi:hypothetical protein
MASPLSSASRGIGDVGGEGDRGGRGSLDAAGVEEEEGAMRRRSRS